MRTFRTATLTVCLTALCVPAVAQETNGDDGEHESVLIPTGRTLEEDQLEELKGKVVAHLSKALEKCIATYPRPEFFDAVVVRYELRRSGDLRGGYIGGAPSPGLYVKSDEERAKREKEGTFTRMVVRKDRDLERCMKRATRGFDTGLDRYSGTLNADFAIAWEGKSPTLTANTFEVKK